MTLDVKHENPQVKAHTGRNGSRWRSMTKSTLEKIHAWQQTLADRRIPDLIVYGLSLFAIALGGSMMAVPEQFSATTNFKLAFSFAGPVAWGVGFLVSGILLAAGFWKDRKSGSYAAAVLTGLFCVFGILAGEAPLNNAPGAVWSGPIVYTYAAWTSAVAVLACQSETGGRHR